MNRHRNILILGGGWGGLTAAHALRGALPAGVSVTVIETRPSFIFYPSLLRIISGERKDLERVESPMSKLLRKDIEIVNEEVLEIDARTKSVRTSGGTWTADHLVIALGAALYPEKIPGFAENAINLFDTAGAFKAHGQLRSFESGKIMILVTRTPFRCPPSPYETAMLTEAFLRERGVRDRVEISVYSPEKHPMPVAGPQVGELFVQMLSQKNIRYFPLHGVSHIDGRERKVYFDNNVSAGYDLLIGIPPHGAPKAIADSGLCDASGFIPVHPQTLRILDNAEELTVKYPGVYALGDCASIRLMNGMMLPKAGIFAEEQAHVVAKEILEAITGKKAEGTFTGLGVCYVDTGGGLAAGGSGNFYAYPSPWIQLEAPSAEGYKAKKELDRIFEIWFEKEK